MALSSIYASTSGRLDISSTWQKLRDQTHDVFLANWHLGLTAFGGPPVHFQIFRKTFVEGNQWINEQTYHELFAICSSLPGPGSTKMLFNINVIHGDFRTGVLAFLLWSLPGAIGMFAFSLGVARIGDELPAAVYALLSGINAATTGIIALAAVQLSRKVVTDQWTKALVFLGGACGILYTALWYFPVLIVVAGLATVAWDTKIFQRLTRYLRREHQIERTVEAGDSPSGENRPNLSTTTNTTTSTSPRHEEALATGSSHPQLSGQSSIRSNTSPPDEIGTAPNRESITSTDSVRNRDIISWQRGLIVIVAFFASFLIIMLVRGLHNAAPRTFSLFANLLLAGTIIFGGGPVVIPLLREYIVAEGWVSTRDFLLGLAMIQAFPGPNFNFAVYLGALAVNGTTLSSVLGAMVAFLGIFLPGLVIHTGFMGLWASLRKNRGILSILRGVNAAAVGLVFTAVYRFWQIGFLDQNNQSGQPLGGSPWWVVVTAASFVGGNSFGLNPPSAVVLGGLMGLIWYGVTK